MGNSQSEEEIRLRREVNQLRTRQEEERRRVENLRFELNRMQLQEIERLEQETRRILDEIQKQENERKIREEEKKKAIEQCTILYKFPEPTKVENRGNFLWPTISSNRITADWSNCDNKFVKIVPIHFHSEEANPIVQSFKSSNNSCYIHKIERVQNPFLLSAFLLKKRELENRFKCHIKEELLFHGTKSENVDSICRYNFDWHRNGQNRLRPYGKGVSFAVKASFASFYSDKNSTQKIMIVCRVLIGKIYDGSYGDIVPEGYDATSTNDGQVIVKFEDNEFYPAYIITYSRKVKNNNNQNLKNCK